MLRSRHSMNWRELLVISSLVAIAGCTTGLPERGSHGASMTLGNPRVVSRERFIADQVEDLAWLRRQLGEKEYYQQGLQGSALSRVFDSMGVDAWGKFAPAPPVTPESPSESSDSGSDAGGTSGGASGGSTSGDELEQGGRSPAGIQGFSSEFLEKLLQQDTQALRQTPSDVLDDRLAFRDSVRSAIRQRAHDDTHDLYGNTLHELTFDLSLFPGHDSGAPYVLVAEIVQPSDDNWKPTTDTVQAMSRSLRSYAVTEASRRSLRAQGRPTTADFEWVSEIYESAVTLGHTRGLITAHDRLGQFLNEAQRLCGKFGVLSDELKKPNSPLAGILAETADELLKKHGERLGKARLTTPASVVGAIRELIEADVCRGAPPIELSYTQSQVTMLEAWAHETPEIRDAIVDKEKKANQAARRQLSNRLRWLEPQGEEYTSLLLRYLLDPGVTSTKLSEYLYQDRALLESRAFVFQKQLPDSTSSDALAPEVAALVFDPPATPSQSPIRVVSIEDGLMQPEQWEAWLAEVRQLVEIPNEQGNIYAEAAQFAAMHIGRQVVDKSCGALAFPQQGKGRLPFSTLALDRTKYAVPQITLCDKTQAFEAQVLERTTEARAVAVSVSPTEQKEVFNADLASLLQNAVRTDFSAVVSPEFSGGVSTRRLRQELLRVAQLEQNTVVVGFVDAIPEGGSESATETDAGGEPTSNHQSTSTFGWLIGPRLEARQRQPKSRILSALGFTEGVTEWQRHRAVHHPVTVTIVAPAALDEMVISVKAYRIDERGSWIAVENGFNPWMGRDNSRCQLRCELAEPSVHHMKIALPVDGNAYARGLLHGNGRDAGSPKLFTIEPVKIRAGQDAHLLITGQNLWRNPQVFLGGLRANSQDVTSTADLNGLHARFEKVSLAPGKHNVTVVTSTGRDILIDTIEVIGAPSRAILPSKVTQPINEKGKLLLSMDVAPPLAGFHEIQLRIKDKKSGKDLFFGQAEEVANAGTGKITLTASFAAEAAKRANGVFSATILVVPSPNANPVAMANNMDLALLSFAALNAGFEGKRVSGSIDGGKIKAGAKLEFDLSKDLAWADIAEAWPGLTFSALKKKLTALPWVDSVTEGKPAKLTITTKSEIDAGTTHVIKLERASVKLKLPN